MRVVRVLLGVLIVGAGPLPFSVTTLDDVEQLAHALISP